MRVEEYIPLAHYTTLRVGGPARFFIRVKNVEDIRDAVRFADEHKLPFFILGEGSNIVVGDGLFNAVVILIEITGVSELQNTDGSVTLIAGAGEGWDATVARAVSDNLCGLENLSAIPGTVGAAPIQNIGAYGSEVCETIEWVEVFDVQTQSIRKLSNEECFFNYRDSIFKHPEGEGLIVLRVAFRLVPNKKPNTSYKDVAAYLEAAGIANPSSADVRTAVIAIRESKLPDYLTVGTVGSFFKNPIIAKRKYEELLENHPELPGYTVSNQVKIPLAWVLEHICGLKGYTEGNITLYKNQPLVLINVGNATAEEIQMFSEHVRTIVKEKIGIFPEYEPTFVGSFQK